MTTDATNALEPQRIGWLGCGEMGSMVLEAAMAGGLLPRDRVVVAERNPERRRALERQGLEVTGDAGVLAPCEVVLVAVRPQDFSSAAADLGSAAHPRLVISVMAGITSGRIREALGPQTRVISVMPNAPVRIGHGMSVIMPDPHATEGDIEFVTALFGELGETIMLEESHLWAATAVSGSGPGFIFLVAEALHQAAIDLGLRPDAAQRLIGQALIGSGQLLMQSDQPATHLRSQVTTPGGTTAAGLEQMQRDGLPEAIRSGIRAAHDRGASLANE